MSDQLQCVRELRELREMLRRYLAEGQLSEEAWNEALDAYGSVDCEYKRLLREKAS